MWPTRESLKKAPIEEKKKSSIGISILSKKTLKPNNFTNTLSSTSGKNENIPHVSNALAIKSSTNPMVEKSIKDESMGILSLLSKSSKSSLSTSSSSTLNTSKKQASILAKCNSISKLNPSLAALPKKVDVPPPVVVLPTPSSPKLNAYEIEIENKRKENKRKLMELGLDKPSLNVMLSNPTVKSVHISNNSISTSTLGTTITAVQSEKNPNEDEKINNIPQFVNKIDSPVNVLTNSNTLEKMKKENILKDNGSVSNAITKKVTRKMEIPSYKEIESGDDDRNERETSDNNSQEGSESDYEEEEEEGNFARTSKARGLKKRKYDFSSDDESCEDDSGDTSEEEVKPKKKKAKSNSQVEELSSPSNISQFINPNMKISTANNVRNKKNAPKKEKVNDEIVKGKKKINNEISDNFVIYNPRRKGLYRAKRHSRKGRRKGSSIHIDEPTNNFNTSNNNKTSSTSSSRMKNSILDDVIDMCMTASEESKNILDTNLIISAPLCNGHGLKAILRTVKKAESAHKGRKFYACSVSQGGGQCDFFAWEDDVANTALSVFLTSNNVNGATSLGSCSSMLLKWKEMSKEELKALCKKYGLDSKGKKVNLLENLLLAHQGGVKDEPGHKDLSTIMNEMDSEDDMESDEEIRYDAVFKKLRRLFRFSSFKDGQEEAIRRIMEGENTLLILSTGGGKSLTYQLSASLLDGLTIVVSPLISLIDDQLKHLPPGLTGASLSGNTSSAQTAAILRDIKDNRLKILFVSPERLFTGQFERLLSSTVMLPKLSLLVIDEAHCLSEWSHNFRPSYLRLRSIINTRCVRPPVLALTATATKAVIKEIADYLDIDMEVGVLSFFSRRKNLRLSASCDTDIFNSMLALLCSESFANMKSIIIYVFKKWDAVDISQRLNDNGHSASCYHAGMKMEERSKVQNSFLRGACRIVVATVAFGMGVDKSNLPGIIHYDMPKSLESYVQEVGRSGRDGNLALCHTFLNKEHICRMYTLMFSDAVDEENLQVLLSLIYSDTVKVGERVTLDIETICRRTDLKESSIATLLTLLSLPPYNAIDLHPSIFSTCKVISTNSSIDALGSRDVLIRCALLNYNKNKAKDTFASSLTAAAINSRYEISFNAVDMGNKMGSDVTSIRRGLYMLSHAGECITEWTQWSFYFTILKLPIEREGAELTLNSTFTQPINFIDTHSAIQSLTKHMNNLVARGLNKLNRVWQFLSECSTPEINLKDFGGNVVVGSSSSEIDVKSANLHKRIEDYFNCNGEEEQKLNEEGSEMEEENESQIVDIVPKPNNQQQTTIKSDIKVFYNSFRADNKTITPRALTRILCGLSSPAYPVVEWKSSIWWNKYQHFDFEVLLSLSRSVMAINN